MLSDISRRAATSGRGTLSDRRSLTRSASCRLRLRTGGWYGGFVLVGAGGGNCLPAFIFRFIRAAIARVGMSLRLKEGAPASCCYLTANYFAGVRRLEVHAFTAVMLPPMRRVPSVTLGCFVDVRGHYAALRSPVVWRPCKCRHKASMRPRSSHRRPRAVLQL